MIDENYSIKGIESPQFRGRIIMELVYLADLKYQKLWCDNRFAHPYWDNLRFCFDTLLEEVGIDEREDRYELLGVMLKSKKEADLLYDATVLLDEFTDEVGPKQPDEKYINHPLRIKLAEASQKALDEFLKNEADNKEFMDFVQAVKNRMQKEKDQGYRESE